MMKPCQNGGKCRSRGVTTSPYYSCVCDAKWTGQNCQTKGTYSTLFTRTNVHSTVLCLQVFQIVSSILVVVVVFFVSVLYSSFPPPPKQLSPGKLAMQQSPHLQPVGEGGGLPYSRLPSSFLQSRLSPQCFWFRFLEKDYGKPIDIKINLLYVPRLLSLHTSVLLMFCQFIIFMNKLLFWFIKNTKNLCKNMFWMRKLKMSL